MEMLKQSEFQTHLANKTLRLGFVGMSNAGKSRLSKILRNECGFYWHDVDAEIQKKLGFVDMNDIAGWLGYPSTPTYAQREQSYLDAEDSCTSMRDIDTVDNNLVLDTTGSVIYLSEPTLSWLNDHCLLVNLEISDDMIQMMFERFLATPKSVIWYGHFKPLPNEQEIDTLRRCYPELLKTRRGEYHKLAHLTIPAQDLWRCNGADALKIITSYLPI